MQFRFFIIFIILVLNCHKIYSQVIEKLLFADTSLFELELHYNFDEIKRDIDSDPNYYSAQLKYRNVWGGLSRIDSKIKTRGIFRKNPDNCSQAPLWIKFNSNETENTPFQGIRKIKLVLQCHERAQFEQLILKEYLVYKIYNIVSPYSYRVRLAKITLVDRLTDRKSYMYGFFIEPIEMLAIRFKGTINDIKNIHPNACNKKMATVVSIFQYMIGHTDWSIKALHNITLIETEDAAPPIPIPFDFDFSGFVNAPYALPAEHLPIKSVTERFFNGYCRSAEEYKAIFETFIKLKPEINSCINSLSILDEKNKDSAKDYIEEFYKIIGNERKVKREFIDGCRTD